MVPLNLEPPVIPPVRLGLIGIGALATALLLAGCGRKGALDPPPGGWQIPSQRMAPASTRPAAPGPVEYDAEGNPIAPEGPKRSIPPDWLID